MRSQKILLSLIHEKLPDNNSEMISKAFQKVFKLLEPSSIKEAEKIIMDSAKLLQESAPSRAKFVLHKLRNEIQRYLLDELDLPERNRQHLDMLESFLEWTSDATFTDRIHKLVSQAHPGVCANPSFVKLLELVREQIKQDPSNKNLYLNVLVDFLEQSKLYLEWVAPASAQNNCDFSFSAIRKDEVSIAEISSLRRSIAIIEEEDSNVLPPAKKHCSNNGASASKESTPKVLIPDDSNSESQKSPEDDIMILDNEDGDMETNSVLISSSSKVDRLCGRIQFNMDRLADKIKQLEESEVSIDDMDDEDSTYLKLDVLKQQYVKLWEKLCSLKEEEKEFTRKQLRWKSLKLDFISNIAVRNRVHKLVNRRKDYFPDYPEIYQIFREEAKELSLAEIDFSAREAFQRLGKDLKARRAHYFKEEFGCHLTDKPAQPDPVLNDESLSKRMIENDRIAEQRIADVLDMFAERQRQIKDETSICEGEKNQPTDSIILSDEEDNDGEEDDESSDSVSGTLYSDSQEKDNDIIMEIE